LGSGGVKTENSWKFFNSFYVGGGDSGKRGQKKRMVPLVSTSTFYLDPTGWIAGKEKTGGDTPAPRERKVPEAFTVPPSFRKDFKRKGKSVASSLILTPVTPEKEGGGHRRVPFPSSNEEEKGGGPGGRGGRCRPWVDF